MTIGYKTRYKTLKKITETPDSSKSIIIWTHKNK